MPLALESDYPASSQFNHIDGIQAFSHHPSLTVGSLSDPSQRGRLPTQSPGGSLLGFPGHNGIRYVTSVPVVHDASFQSDSGVLMSPVHSRGDSVSTSPSSASSSLAFSPFTNVFQTNLSSPVSYQSSAAPSYASVPTYSQSYGMTDIRPPSHPHMPPPSRSPGHQTPVSPQKSVRDDYITSTPHVLRHPRPPRSPVDLISGSSHSSLTTTPRSIISPSTVPPPSPGHGFRHPLDPGQLESSAHGLGQSATSPPLYRTNIIHQIRTADGQMIRAEIDAQIDKGFFLADQEWTCYRRNYFSVACSYSLKPPMAPGPLYLRRSDNTQAAENISAFAMSISAVVDGAEGKPIDLVQHTPKRDKGPQGKPDRITLSPYPAGSMGMFPGNSSTTGSLLADPRAVRKHEYDPPYSQQGTQPQTIANFERIQFKSATANNGKRRAAQQYYNLIVELYANVGSSMSSEGQWIKVATRMSASMVVRGRSPGHYQEDRRASSSSTGPGGPAARDNGRGPSTGSSGPSSVNRSIGDPMSLMSGSGSMLGGGGYQGANGLSFHHSPSSMDSHPLSSRSSSGGHLENSIDPIIPSEETNAMDEGPGYQYYPSPLYESDGNHTRPAQSLPSFMPSIYRDDRSGGMPHGHYDGQLTRQDHGLDNKRNMREDYGGGFNLPQPSLLRFPGAFPSKEYGRADVFRSSCSRFQGTDTSRGHYPDLPAL